MRYAPLQTVSHRVAVGAPLPFNVYDKDRTLLLARERVIEDARQLEALYERGTLVDVDELLTTAERVARAPAWQLPALWSACMDEVGHVLRDSSAPSFGSALDDAAAPVLALVARDPDLAIFQVLRQEGRPQMQYGVNHSVHVAIIAQLVGQRLGWAADDTTRAFKAALTMNIAMLELQGQLATQLAPPTAAQRQAIHEHPQRGVAMLEQAGVTDAEWLAAVAEHHEQHGGGGYPLGLRETGETATLLQRADDFAAKLSSRAGRESQAADEAARAIFRQHPGHPVTAALVKEFGIYPPGCFVSLASGETAIVVRRGETVMTPMVAALTTMYGEPLSSPQRRDTSQPLHAIVGVLERRQVRVKVAIGALVAVAA